MMYSEANSLYPDMSRGRMNQDDELLLQSHIIYLKDNIDPDHVIDHLLQEHVINFDQHKEVKLEKTCPDKTEKLLHILRFAGTDSYPRFVHALRKSGYATVADKLSKERGTRCSPENVVQDITKETKHPTENTESIGYSEADSLGSTRSSINKKDISLDIDTQENKVLPTPVKSFVSKSCQVNSDEISGEPEYEEMSDETYDIPDYSNKTALCLSTPYNDNSLSVLSEVYDFEVVEAMNTVPGWCPKIKDSNHSEVVKSLKSGDFFIWFSKIKDAYIITLRTDSHKNGIIYVKVKTRADGSNVLFRIVKDKEFRSLEDLFKHYIEVGLPMKFIER